MNDAKKLYYVSTDRGCAIRAGRDESEIMRQMAREIGTDHVEEIREATEKDVAWVKRMGGRVPKI